MVQIGLRIIRRLGVSASQATPVTIAPPVLQVVTNPPQETVHAPGALQVDGWLTTSLLKQLTHTAVIYAFQDIPQMEQRGMQEQIGQLAQYVKLEAMRCLGVLEAVQNVQQVVTWTPLCLRDKSQIDVQIFVIRDMIQEAMKAV